MSIAKKLLIAVVVAGIVLAVGLTIAVVSMPNERRFENEVEISAPAEVVWQVIKDRERYTEWQPQLERVELVDGAKWVEYPKSAPEPLRFRLVNDSSPTRMAFSYTMGKSMSGTWAGEVAETAGGVRLRTIDTYKVDGWLMKLMMGTFFDLDSFAKEWNGHLKQRAESLAKR